MFASQSLPSFFRWGSIFSLLFIATALVRADVPADPAVRAKLVGQPKALQVQPDKLTLNGPRATAQLVVTGSYADGTIRDLTHLADFVLEGTDPLIVIDGDRFISAQKNGTATLAIAAGGVTVKVPVAVQNVDKPQPVSFRNEVIAALNVGGCNSGACHGTPTGKNGFKLSLRGYDPASDYLQLTRELMGRRTDRQNPDAEPAHDRAAGPGRP